MKTRTKNKIDAQPPRAFGIETLEPRQLLSDAFPFAPYTAGYSLGMAMADLNGDGNPDLITHRATGTSDIKIQFGLGNGRFIFGGQYTNTNAPLLISTGDFNSDGKPDILFGDGAGNFNILPNLGDGLFGPALIFKLPGIVANYVNTFAVTDLNGDGLNDIAVSCGSMLGVNRSGVIDLYIATAPGTFATPATITIAPGAATFYTTLAISDVNGDGMPDLVDGVVGTSSNATRVGVFLGLGSGNFATPTYYTAGNGVPVVAVADVTGDKVPDIVIADGNGMIKAQGIPQAGSPLISVLPNLGNGTFAAAINYGAVTNYAQDSQSIAIADFNDDGKLDVAVGSYYQSRLTTLTNQGGGAFSSLIHTEVGRVTAMAASDFNRDGITDLTVQTGSSGYTLTGNGDGTFGRTQIGRSASNSTSITLSADINNDNHPDLLMINSASPNSLSVYRNLSDGTFAAPVSYACGAYPVVFKSADVNSDGWLDLVAISATGAIAILKNNGDGTFAAPVNYSTGLATTSADLGDINGDGKPDLAIANGGSANSVSVLINIGNGNFNSPVSYSIAGPPTQLSVVDTDKDGFADVVVDAGKPFVLYGQNNGTLAAAISYTTLASSGLFVLADINNDGLMDTLVENSSTAINQPLWVFLNQGHRSYASGVSYAFSFGSNTIPFAVTDVTGDGKPDVVSNVQSVLVNNGNGTFAPATKTNVGASSENFTVADVNGDGFADLIYSNFQVLTGTAAGTFSTLGSFHEGWDSANVSFSDFNGDGKPDALFTASVTNPAPYTFASVALNTYSAALPIISQLVSNKLAISTAGQPGLISISESAGVYNVNYDSHTDSYPVSSVSSIQASGDVRITTTLDAPISVANGYTWITAGTVTIAAGASGGGINTAYSNLLVPSGATINYATAASPADRTLVVFRPDFVSTGGGKIDLGGNDLIVPATSPASFNYIQSLIASGFANGAWTGAGIVSSAAANDPTHLRTLAAIQNSDGTKKVFTAFDGRPMTNQNDTVVKYTYFGDADLSGSVDGSDYSLIDNGFAQHLTGWANGDFNYDGKIDGSDYTLIDNAFNMQGTSMASVASTLIATPSATTAQRQPKAPAAFLTSSDSTIDFSRTRDVDAILDCLAETQQPFAV